MKPLDMGMFLTPEEVAALFRREGDVRFAYRAAVGRGFLRPAARRFGRRLLFDRAEVERIIEEQSRGRGKNTALPETRSDL